MSYKKLEITPVQYSQSTIPQTGQIYKGFSTIGEPKNVRLFDFELIKQDMINHFNTRKGERVMNPTYGSLIWDVIYEPLTAEIRQLVSDDVKSICNSDPRVVATQILVNEQEYGLLLEITLQSINSNQTELLKVSFDKKRS